MHLPDNYDPENEYPTVVGFHGRDGSGSGFAADTNMNYEQWTGDKIAVYPDGVDNGTEKNWAGASYSAVSVGEDFQFVLDLLADLRVDFCVDDARIYAVGHSNGGGFVNTIACNATVGGEFAAFAPVSGAYYSDNDENYGSCDPARALTPILEIHGGADPTVPYGGGKGAGGQLPAIPDWLDRWADRNDCGDPTTEEFHEGIAHTSWVCQGTSGAVQHYKAEEHRHGWPLQGSGPWPINGNDLIFEFFSEFTKPSA
ncbi:esterase PHB depolymerase domain-containing protein [Sarocladium implicatum]|nr:esterase PHB depolymerase domain-containing protein [Sarocladium implicatum]